MGNDIIYITINDWQNYYFKDDAKYSEFLKMLDDTDEEWYNYIWYDYDQAMEYLIVVSKEDLIKHGYEELIENGTPSFELLYGCTQEDLSKVLKYNPSLWNTYDNGNYMSWDRCLDILFDKKN